MSNVAVDLLLQAIPVAFVMFVVLNFGGLLTWVERKQSAIMQDRIGANRASIFGICGSAAVHCKRSLTLDELRCSASSIDAASKPRRRSS